MPLSTDRLWQVLASALALALAAVLAQQEWGLPGWTEIVSLDIDKTEMEVDGKAYRVRLPDHQDRPLIEHRSQLLRDGEPWGIRSRSNKYVVEQGNGRYRIRGKYLRFSTHQNVPLAEDEHRHAIRLPAVPNSALVPSLLGALILVVGWGCVRGRAGGKGLASTSRRPARDALVVFALALAVRIAVLLGGFGLDSGGLVVRGMPYSDGIGWNEMAIGLKEGRGIEGSFYTHRPFYGIFLGSAYALFGDSVGLAKFVNCLAGALSTALIYLLVALAFRNRILGFAVAALVGFGAPTLEWVHLTVTEDVGFALTLLSLYLFWAAYDPPPEKRRWWMFLLAGIFFGLGNLTRTLTIFAFPFYFLPLLWEFLRDRGEWRKPFLSGAMICLGVALTFGPWMARQKIQYGFLTISSNSADLLYAAADPRWGSWGGSGIYEEASEAGVFDDITARTAYFNRRLKEVVQEDPARYVRFLRDQAFEFVNSFRADFALVRLVATLAMLALALSLALRSGTVLPLVALALLLPLWQSLGERVPNLALLPLCIALAFAEHRHSPRALRGLTIILGTLVACIAMSAMVGNFGQLRSAPFVRWMDTALKLVAMAAMLRWVTLGLGRAAKTLRLSWIQADEKGASLDAAPPAWNSFVRVTTWFLVGFCTLGILNLGVRTLAYDDPEPVRLAPGQVKAAETWLTTQHPDADLAALRSEGKLFIDTFLIDSYHCEIGADEDVDHWSRLFEIRPYARACVLGRVGLDPGVRGHPLRSAIIAGGLPEGAFDRPLALVAMENVKQSDYIDFGYEESLLEAVGLFPFDPETGEIDLANPLATEPTPEAGRLLRRND